MAGQLIFQPPTFHWPSEDQQMAFEEWQSHVTPRIGSVQYPQREMVCQHCWFPGHQRFQEMATSWNLQRRWKKENTRGCLHRLRKHLRGFNIPVELYQWNVQWHTAGRARNHWPARSMHQDLGQKMQLSIKWREGKDADWSYPFMRQNILKLKSG